MQLIQLKLSKKSYMDACRLVSVMEKYSYSLLESDEEQLRLYASISQGMPLPSGRWGNAIALALETNNYISANYLVEHSKELNLETDKVVSEFGGKNSWGLKDEFLFSLLTHEALDEDITNEMENVLNSEKLEKIIDHNNRQLAAIESLEKKLEITSEEKQLIKVSNI